jgi:hypothetical protein
MSVDGAFRRRHAPYRSIAEKPAEARQEDLVRVMGVRGCSLGISGHESS